MRFFNILIILLFLSSCGLHSNSGHLSYVKVDKKEIPVIVKEKKEDLVVKTSEINNINIQKEDYSTIAELKTEDILQETELEIIPKKVIVKQNIEDIEPDIDENQLIVNQAIDAERDARTSVALFGAGLISILLPFIGIIFFVLGLIFYSRANSSRYITPYGEERLNISKSLLIVDSVFLILWTLLFLFILVLIFL